MFVDGCWNFFKVEKYFCLCCCGEKFFFFRFLKVFGCFLCIDRVWYNIFFFYGILKKLVFKVYRDNYEFFEGLGEGDLID